MMPQDNWLQSLRERQQAFFAGGSPWGDRFQGGMPGFSKKGAGRAPDPAIPMVGGDTTAPLGYERAPRASSDGAVISSSPARSSGQGGIIYNGVRYEMPTVWDSTTGPPPTAVIGSSNNGKGMGNYSTGMSGSGAASGGGGAIGQALGGLVSQIGSYMAGGVNTPNPGNLVNRAAAALSPAQGQPTAADRPRANPMR